jgi:hypothetical protein
VPARSASKKNQRAQRLLANWDTNSNASDLHIEARSEKRSFAIGLLINGTSAFEKSDIVLIVIKAV